MNYRPMCDVWLCARPKVKGFYGCFPSGFLSRARVLLGVGHEDAVLHVCAGKVRDYPFDGVGPNDKALDLDPETRPDFLMDAREISVKPYHTFDGYLRDGAWPCPARTEPCIEENDQAYWPAVLIDRPYTQEDAQHYAACVRDKLPDANDLLKRCLSIVRPGGRVGILDYFVPRPPKKGVKFVALVGVLVGFGNRMRAYSVFEREVAKTPEQKARIRCAIMGKAT
jgi:hypothetical protein